MKFRALLEAEFLDIEAQSIEGAQEMAFAKHVRDLRPSDFTCWPTGEHDEWKATAARPES